MRPVDDYLAGLDRPDREAFARVLALAMQEAPEAEQGTSYGMAVLRYRGRPLLGFRAAAKHLAVHPFSPAAVDAVRGQIPGASLSKGTVRFTAEAPLAEATIRDLVLARRDEIDRC